MNLIGKFVAAILLALALANILGVNGIIARHSVVIATYTKLIPPFTLEAKFTNGEFRYVPIGSRKTDVKTVLQASRASCRVIDDDMLKELQNWNGTLSNDQEIILRCVEAGIAWNEIYEFQEDQLVQVRIAASMWM